MNQLYGTTNHTQMITLVWIPRVTATLSSLGSLAVIYMILSTRKEKLTKSNHRLILALSTVDTFHSAAYATTTLASPRDSHVYGAMGNNGTCSAQGFLIMLGLAVPMYNTSLSLFFLLTIQHRVRQSTFSAKIEPIFHTVSILAPLTLAIVSLSIDGIASESIVCFLKSDIGSIAINTLWTVITGIVAICFIINLYSVISISHYVITRLNSVRRYSYSTTQKERRITEKREVIVQSLFYIGAFFATFAFTGLTYIKESFFLEVCSAIFFPLQGFWNFLLYSHPIVKRVKKTNPDKSWVHIYWQVIFHANEGNDPILQIVRNRRDINTMDVDDTPSSPLARNELQILQANDSDETEESKCEEIG